MRTPRLAVILLVVSLCSAGLAPVQAATPPASAANTLDRPLDPVVLAGDQLRQSFPPTTRPERLKSPLRVSRTNHD